MTARARQFWRDKINGGRFHCAGCQRDFRGHRALNAHHMAAHSRMWTSRKARQVERAMGKQASNARRHAMGWLRAAGLRDKQGNRTAKARARPELRGRVSVARLRTANRHDMESQRTDRRAARHERRGRPERAIDVRMAHHQRWPERTRT